MDTRGWMYEDRTSELYGECIFSFIDASKAIVAQKNQEQTKCPCLDHNNKKMWADSNVVIEHLTTWGFYDGYSWAILLDMRKRKKKQHSYYLLDHESRLSWRQKKQRARR